VPEATKLPAGVNILDEFYMAPFEVTLHGPGGRTLMGVKIKKRGSKFRGTLGRTLCSNDRPSLSSAGADRIAAGKTEANAESRN